jgi:hypothetical protein
MKKMFLLLAIGLFLSCEKEIVQDQTKETQLAKAAAEISSNGAAQVSGVGFYAEPLECDVAAQGATYAVKMTGDLEGCLYVFIDDFNCSPSGTYRETGREYFVGTYKEEGSGTFWTTYKFEAKYEGCAENGAALGAEILGRCQHPIVKGSGDGIFEGVTGRLDLKDDIEAGNFPYRGHLKF